MNPGSPLNKASEFWSTGSISDLIRSFFNCGCVYKRRKNDKRPLNDDIMEPEDQSGSGWKYSFFVDNDNLQRHSPPKSSSPQESMILTFEQTLKKIRVEEKPPEFLFDDEGDQIKQNPVEYLSIGASREDDELLKQLEHEERLSTASKKISKRSKKSEEEKKGSQARRPWQPHEDKMVLDLYEELGPSWAAISRRMDGARTGKQIRDRYLGKLDPKIKTAEWTQQEDDLIVSLFYKFGKKWCEIAKNIPGRTESMVKNRVQWRYKWMLEENPVMPEQIPPTRKKSKKSQKQQKGLTSRTASKSNLLASDESSKNILYDSIDNSVTGDPIPQYRQQINPTKRNSLPDFGLFSESSILSDFAGVDPQHSHYMQQHRIIQNDNLFRSAENFNKIKHDKQKNSNAMEEEVDLPNNRTPYLNLNPLKNTLTTQNSGMHLEGLSSLENSNANVEKSIEDKINYLTAILQNLPGSNNMSESLEKINQENNQNLSQEEATRRIEQLKNRLQSLEMLLQLTYKQVFSANGLQNPNK